MQGAESEDAAVSRTIRVIFLIHHVNVIRNPEKRRNQRIVQEK